MLLWVVVWALAAPEAAAQTRPDSLPSDSVSVHELEGVVVVAKRSPAVLATATSAVSRLTAEDLRRLPVRTTADALQHVPGLAFLDFDGTARDPKLTTRGFYGGGESEYVVFLLDGRPLNGLEGGLVDWDMVPLTAIERIEVLRGGASSLYGDAAVGAVINVVTGDACRAAARWSLAGDELGSVRAEAGVCGTVAGRTASAFTRVENGDGFREHSHRRTGTAGANVALLGEGSEALTLSTLHHWRRFEEPGPLATAALAEDRTRASVFHRFDRTEERTHRLALDGVVEGSGGVRVSGHLTGGATRSDAVRTLPLSAGFADTKFRARDTERLLGSVQLEAAPALLPWTERLLVGTDFSLGRMGIDYRQVATGDATVYAAATGTRGERVAAGSAVRKAAAAFAQYEVSPVPAVRIQAGARVDWLGDRYLPESPSEGGALEAEHVALSPKAGINVRYVGSARHEGRLYATVGRSFKAPTLNQLFDPRPVPVPFPPFAITTSNELLEPQHGVNVEVGLYHRAALGRALDAELSLSVYRMQMEDELDFDLETFRYVNIGRSRHLGVEAGLKLYGPGGFHAFGNYTLQDATARNGDFAGKRLKAIPPHVAAVGIGARRPAGLHAALTATSAHGVWLDDANTLELPGHTRIDAEVSYPIRGLRLSLEVFNLLDAEYSTTGFPDAAGSGEIFYYPAAGRTLRLTLSGAR